MHTATRYTIRLRTLCVLAVCVIAALVSPLLSRSAIASVRTADINISPPISVHVTGSSVEAGAAHLLVSCSSPCRGEVLIKARVGITRYGSKVFRIGRGQHALRIKLNRAALEALQTSRRLPVKAIIKAKSGQRRIRNTSAFVLRPSTPIVNLPELPFWLKNKYMLSVDQEWQNPMQELARGFAGYSINIQTPTGEGLVRSIEGTFTVPSVENCPTLEEMKIPESGKSTATWVGIDGAGALEQDGVYSLCEASGPAYLPFIDMYPSPAVFLNFPVHAGDAVRAIISAESTPGATPQLFRATLQDLSNGVSFSETYVQPTPAKLSEAQWLTELQPSTWPALSVLTWTNLGFQTSTTPSALAKNERIFSVYWAVREPATDVCAAPGPLINSGTSFSLADAPCASAPQIPPAAQP